MNASKAVIYGFALFQCLLLSAFCFDIRSDGKFPYLETDEDPPMAIVTMLWSGVFFTLGIRLDAASLLKTLHVPTSPDDSSQS